MPTPPVTVLADAGPAIGLGHLSRAGAVAAALRVRGHAVTTVVVGEELAAHDGIAWTPIGDDPPPGDGPLLIDSYRVDAAALGATRPVATFWDGAGAPPDGVALAIHGPELACLRPMFWGIAARTPARAVARIVVATGGGAAGGVAELAAVAQAAAPGVEVAAILGPYADEALPGGVVELRAPARMVDVLQAADLVVTAAGQTMLETLCAGTPCVATAVVDNQRAQLARMGDAVRAAEAGEIGAAVAALVADPAERARLAGAGRALIDGYGALRVAARLATL